MPIAFSTNGWYIARVDTGIGEQYAAIQLAQPSSVDGLSAHYTGLMSGPAATAEAAWAEWRTSSAPTHFKA